MDKSCRTCKDNKACSMINRVHNNVDIETTVHCKLEDGIISDILQEQLDLSEIYEELQNMGIIKKTVKINSIDDEGIKQNFIEQISNKIWDYIIDRVSDIQPETNNKMVYDDFYCSEWR